MAKVSILGTGGFGVSLAATCFKYGHQVTLWGLFPEEVDAIVRDGEHKKLLPGVPVNPGIRVTADIGEAAGADLLILAVPSFAVRETAARAKPILGEKTVVVSVAKGLEPGTGKLLSDVIEEELPVQAVYDPQLGRVDDARHPMGRYMLPCPFPVEPGWMLRKRIFPTEL